MAVLTPERASKLFLNIGDRLKASSKMSIDMTSTKLTMLAALNLQCVHQHPHNLSFFKKPQQHGMLELGACKFRCQWGVQFFRLLSSADLVRTLSQDSPKDTRLTFQGEYLATIKCLFMSMIGY